MFQLDYGAKTLPTLSFLDQQRYEIKMKMRRSEFKDANDNSQNRDSQAMKWEKLQKSTFRILVSFEYRFGKESYACGVS